MTRRPTTLRQARGKREMWPHVVDARRLAPVCHRVGDGWETRLVPFTPTEDMRPVCTKCHERIEPDERHVDVFDRPTFFQHLKCPERRGHPPSPSTVVDVTKFATPAPPVDEELERERKRFIIGTRARAKAEIPYSGGQIMGTIASVRRDHRGVLVDYTHGGFDHTRNVEPVPEPF